VPQERGRASPIVPLGDLDDVTVLVVLTGIGSIMARLAILASIRVLGARDVDLARTGTGLDILAAVHRRGSDSISGHPGEDQHLLMCHARHRGLAVQGQWNPCTTTEVGVPTLLGPTEAGHVEITLREQPEVMAPRCSR